MSLLHAMSITLAHAKQRATRAALRTLISARHPTLACDSTVIWDIPYKSIDELEIGVGVRIMPFCEILVTPHSRFSSKRGRLSLGDNVVIATGVNLRAAGGEIRIGANSGIGQHSVVVAANHQVILGEPPFSRSVGRIADGGGSRSQRMGGRQLRAASRHPDRRQLPHRRGQCGELRGAVRGDLGRHTSAATQGRAEPGRARGPERREVSRRRVARRADGCAARGRRRALARTDRAGVPSWSRRGPRTEAGSRNRADRARERSLRLARGGDEHPGASDDATA